MCVLPYLHLLASFSVHILKCYLFVVKLVMLLGCNNLLSISVDQVMLRVLGYMQKLVACYVSM